MGLLDGKTVLVTGAGSGIGAGVARVCHREGASVAVSDVDAASVERVAESLGSRAVAVECDVRKADQLRRFVERAVAAFGRIDGLVNNAGINSIKPSLEITEAEWDNVLSINLRSAFLLTQLACRQMLSQDGPGGSIVNVASVHTAAALPASVAYDAAKWGMIGLTKCLAIELADRNLRFNAVSPGLVATKIWEEVKDAAPSHAECEAYFRSNIPIGRPIDPEEVADLVAFLLSDRSRAIVGSNLFIDGGMSSQLLSRPPFEFRQIGGGS
jgi:NAD(P)-dependent dehydrogenase (short-subunit alcohol dehydrogenase family)